MWFGQMSEVGLCVGVPEIGPELKDEFRRRAVRLAAMRAWHMPAALIAGEISLLNLARAFRGRRRDIDLFPLSRRKERHQPAIAYFERIALAVEVIGVLVDLIAKQFLDQWGRQYLLSLPAILHIRLFFSLQLPRQ